MILEDAKVSCTMRGLKQNLTVLLGCPMSKCACTTTRILYYIFVEALKTVMVLCIYEIEIKGSCSRLRRVFYIVIQFQSYSIFKKNESQNSSQTQKPEYIVNAIRRWLK